MPIDNDTKIAVMAVISRYSQAYYQKNVDSILAMTIADFIGFGSGPDEKVSSQDELRFQLERDFAQSDQIDMKFGPATISAEGNVAWYASDCTIAAVVGGKKISLDGRITAVLKKVGNEWLFVHMHFSVPDRGQEAGKSFPDIK
jgi:ketosteroid isomerase-like protein